MPLAVQALLPLAVLLLAASAVHWRPRRPENGWVAIVATAAAAIVALVELLRLSAGERVDVPYLTTFPYADLMVRLDGLSLAFATITLVTAALLMTVRQFDRSDRRHPWTGWLLTSAAVTALIMAGNLVLLYILLQVVTLTWSGAVDETAPRRRALRLTLQIADIGLLLAAASAIQSVGTSSFSGVPSDTFGIASFSLMLAPVLVRIGAIAWAARRPLASVAFGPAIAWLVPAAYILLRLLALMGGRLPDRPTAVILFAIAALAAIVFALSALSVQPLARAIARLLAAEVALALALSTGNDPLLTIASTWMWIVLIPLAGLVSVRTEKGSIGESLTLIHLAMIPVSVAFVGVWLAALAFNARGLAIVIVPLALIVVACAVVGLSRIVLPRGRATDAAAIWAVALAAVAALPIVLINPLVIPAASTVRLVPAATVSAGLFGLSSNFGRWPALIVCIAGWIVLAVLAWLVRSRPLSLTLPDRRRARWLELPRLGAWRMPLRPDLSRIPVWSRFVPWAAFAVVLIIALYRP